MLDYKLDVLTFVPLLYNSFPSNNTIFLIFHHFTCNYAPKSPNHTYITEFRCFYLAHSDQKQANNFDEILQANAQLAKYLKEKLLSEHCRQLSFKYFVEYFSFLKLLSKVF